MGDAERESLLELASRAEVPEPALCLKLAQASFAAGEHDDAYAWLARVAESGGPFRAWASAAAMLARFEAAGAPRARRSVRLALAGSYTTSQLGPLIRLAALRRGVHVELYEAPFDAYAQEILDPAGALYAFEPDYVLIAPHDGAVRLPVLSHAPADDLDAEVARWEGLWSAVGRHSGARVLQHNVAIRPETAWGHVAARTEGARDELLRALNTRLARAAGESVLVVDCDRIAAAFGKTRWFDDRFWHLAKQAVALDALPELARHTAAVLAGAEGLSAKCVVLDLDNTLWGGVVAEDGIAGIRLGGDAAGEAHIAFQEHLVALRSRGILLAVVSKNNERDAREPFERHPDMRLKLSDFAAFVANWDDKPANLRDVAATLGIGLDALAFVDDNPAERAVVRRLVPEVEVVPLPADPSGYVRALSETLLFETPAITGEDLARAEQYRARAAAASMRREASSLDEFYAGLGMEAHAAPFDELHLPRIAQLVAKTNQFNVTTRRHGLDRLRAFADDERCITMYLRLRDHFADHGLVAVLVAEQAGATVDIDTWLMSCRVIGRTAEHEMLKRLCEIALERGCTKVRATFVPTAKNGIVPDVLGRLGFARVADVGDASIWEYDIETRGVVSSDFIRPWSAVAHA